MVHFPQGPINVDSGTTNSCDKIATEETSNTNNLDKKEPSKQTVQNSTPTVLTVGQGQLEENPTYPGEIAMFPSSNDRPELSPPNIENTLIHNENHSARDPTVINGGVDVHNDGEHTLNAVLVNDDTSVVANANILDIEADEKNNRRR